MLPPLVAIVMIYLKHNVQLLQTLNLEVMSFLAVDGEFFFTLLSIQTVLSFFIAASVGPGLVAPDLANNALPLYLSRPFSRAEYVLGKLTVLAVLTSLITWIPDLLIIGIETNLSGISWLTSNLRLPVGIFIGSWIWILVISLVSLAISAWVKFRPVATASLFGVFFALAAFGGVTNQMLALDPGWGSLLSMPADMGRLWTWLLMGSTEYARLVANGSSQINGLPIWGSFAAMAAFGAVALFLLNKKVRAAEVVRG
jgi:ABC-2 type transport system permease protein